MKTWCISGGCGCLGAPLAKAMIAEGYKVRVLDDCSRGKHNRLKVTDCEIWAGSICHAPFVREALKGCDGVIHLAAINGTRNFYERPGDVLEVGVKGIVNVMDACIREGVREILVASSSEVYHEASTVPTPETVPLVVPDPHNPRYSYSSSKILTEMMTLHYGAEHFTRRLIVRPHNIVGPDMAEDHVIPQFVRKALAIKSRGVDPLVVYPFLADGIATSRSFCHIDDAISGFMTVLKKGRDKEIYNIGTEERVSVHSLATWICQHVGFVCQPFFTEEAHEGSPRWRCPDVRKLKGLGWYQKRDILGWLPEVVKWYAENPTE